MWCAVTPGVRMVRDAQALLPLLPRESMKAPLVVHPHTQAPRSWRLERLLLGSPIPEARLSVLTVLAFRKGFYIQVI